MPVLVGETCYEGHMQQGFGDVQRRMFWGSILSGAAGHTYGAAGIWHASVEGDPGCASAAFGGTKVYDWTTWKEGMNYPGATQLGIGKKLLEQYPWSRFEPHPEWAPGCIAAGIPGEVRFIYQPRRGIYNWEGTVVKNLEPGVTYHVFYFDPATGRRFDQGTVTYAGPTPPPFKGHTKPLLFEDTFDKADAASWKDYGTPTRRENSRLVGGKGMVTVAEKISELDLMASVDANRDAEAGIILRFHDADNYLVALYSPLLKAIFLHDRKNGQWGEMLGRVDVPEVGSENPSPCGGVRRIRGPGADRRPAHLCHAGRQGRKHDGWQDRAVVVPDRGAAGVRSLRGFRDPVRSAERSCRGKITGRHQDRRISCARPAFAAGLGAGARTTQTMKKCIFLTLAALLLAPLAALHAAEPPVKKQS